MTGLPRRRIATAAPHRHRSRIAAALLSAVVAVQAFGFTGAAVAADRPAAANERVAAAAVVDPAQATTGAPDAPPVEADPAGGVRPGIHYDDAMAHENDKIEFSPGDRVSVPFSPRAGDTWPVGGRAPRKLPPGQASGRDMAASPQGSRWAADGLTPPGKAKLSPVDGPTVDAADVEPAEPAAAVAPSELAPNEPQNAGLLRQVFGFLPYWEVGDAWATINYDVLSTVAYFSVGSDSKGNLLKRNADGTVTTGWGGWTSARMTNVINTAHQRKTRVVLTISVFAWTTAQADRQRAILGSATARLNLARQAAAAVRDRGADGINLDFEPIASGYADEFTAFVRTVRAELNRIAPGYQLTFDTTGWIGNYPLEAATAAGAADAIFVMGYDYRTGGSNPVGSISPLTGAGYDLTDTVRAYLARVPASKLILGIPYYGRAWSTSSDALHATNTSGTKFGASATVIYDSAVDLAAKHGRRWDSIEQSPYVVYRRENCTSTYGCVTSWRQVYYDDRASLAAKYDMINRYRLRGVGIWALGYDAARRELNTLLAAKFLRDTTAPLVGIRNVDAEQRDAGFRVTWAGEDISGIASYDVQVSRDGGGWSTWLTGTTQTSDVFLGAAGHGYAFRARGRDGKGNVSSWNSVSNWIASPTLAVGGFGVVTSDHVNTRTAPDTSAGVAGELNTGAMVSIVGGPRTADGYTWWQISGPISEWLAVGPIDVGVWVAAGPATAPWLVAAHAPNTTFVNPVIRDFSVGDSSRAFSPNGDGTRDTLRVGWTNAVAVDSVALNVLRPDGSLVTTVSLPDRAAGAHTFDWNGLAAGVAVPDGRYMLALRATIGSSVYSAPSSTPVTAAQLGAFGVTVDTVAPATFAPVAGLAASGNLAGPTGTRVRLAWPGASDAASGLVRYELQSSIDGGAWGATAPQPASATSAFAWTYFGHRYQYRLRALDVAGNASGWLTTTPLTVTPIDDTNRAVRFSTGWSKLTSAYALGGSLRYAGRSGASVTLTTTGRQLAVLAKVGPLGGSASVYVNGVFAGRLSMYSTKSQYKRIVWARDFGTSATRTITIRNLATAGHPRVYVDAILVGR